MIPRSSCRPCVFLMVLGLGLAACQGERPTDGDREDDTLLRGPNGLLGEYFDSVDFRQPMVVRTDPKVDFDWGRDAPAPSMGADTFSVRWTGAIRPRYSDSYTFHIVSDDGVRLTIDGQVVVDNWTDHAAREDSGTIYLRNRRNHDFKLEYYDSSGAAVVKLFWSSRRQTREIVPTRRLAPATPPAAMPTEPPADAGAPPPADAGAPPPPPVDSGTPPPPPPPPSGGLVPGPNAALHASHPYYSCVTNRYVATAANGGSDSNDGTAPTVGGGHGPWLTLHHAASSIPNPAPGWCINVGDGTYTVSGEVGINRGGNAASMTGFTVWRSTNLLGAKLVATSSAWNILSVTASYTIIDGLELQGARTGSGINTCFSCCGNNGIHHVTVLNSYVHDMGENGLSLCWGEYYWAIHNRLDNNAYNSWNSGVSIYEPAAMPGYAPTAYDNQWTPYHNVIAHNRCSGNFTNPSGGPHTDGNGIIYDDTQHSQNSPNTVYAPRGLILGNVVWGNGGAGIQVGPGSAHADVFNNTAYNNYLDTVNNGTWRGEISCSYGIDNHFKNNIGIAKPGSGILSNNAPFLGGNRVGTNSWSSNIAYGNDVYMEGGDAFPSSSNMPNTNPLLVNVGAGNFALQSGSPAIGAGEVVPYWPQQTPGAIDIGACPDGVTSCP